MITPAQRAWLLERAYLPEHLPDYVGAVSPVEPHLADDFVYYTGRGRLVFVAYPLTANPHDPGALLGSGPQAARLLAQAIAAHAPGELAVLAPAPLQAPHPLAWSPPDAYYGLALPAQPPKKVRSLLRRAQRELTAAREEKFRREHKKLAQDFLRRKRFDPAARRIYQSLGAYLKAAPAAWLYAARDARRRLAACAIADFSSAACAFYMFNLPAAQPPPGASDLLLGAILDEAVRLGRPFANLGLGVNPGIAFFKQKWGARPFLPYTAGTWTGERVDVLAAFGF